MTALGDVTLPDNLYWDDEYSDWEPVQQRTEPTLTGALVVEEDALQAGQPITLKGAWVPRSTVEALDALLATPGAQHSLTLPDGRSFTVMGRRGQGRAVEARPLFPTSAPTADTLYELTLRLMRI